MRNAILDRGLRPDGRGPDDIRQISVEVGVLPRTHGSGLFTRGQTQVLTVCTLGTGADEQMLDGLGIEDKKRYIHHYNFPPFTTGETRRGARAVPPRHRPRRTWPSARSSPCCPAQTTSPT